MTSYHGLCELAIWSKSTSPSAFRLHGVVAFTIETLALSATSAMEPGASELSDPPIEARDWR